MIIVTLLAVTFWLPKCYIWYTFCWFCYGNVSVILPENGPL